MTPVSRIEGVPFGSEEYAVQLGPEGLSFLQYATLTIQTKDLIPVNEKIFFGYQENGDNLALALPVIDSSEMKILIDHFGGYGVSKELLADIEPVRQKIGGDAEARIQSAVAAKMMAKRQRVLKGQEGEGGLDLGGFFEQLEKEVVKPRLAAAGESCAAGRLAIQTAASFEKMQQLVGESGDGFETFKISSLIIS